MQVEYRIFVANYVRHCGRRTSIYNKYLFLLAFVSNKLLTLMPTHLAYSAIFPPRRVAFSTWRGRKDGWNDIYSTDIVV